MDYKTCPGIVHTRPAQKRKAFKQSVDSSDEDSDTAKMTPSMTHEDPLVKSRNRSAGSNSMAFAGTGMATSPDTKPPTSLFGTVPAFGVGHASTPSFGADEASSPTFATGHTSTPTFGTGHGVFKGSYLPDQVKPAAVGSPSRSIFGMPPRRAPN